MSDEESIETRQKNELEALQAIFGDDLRDLRGKAAWNIWSPLNISITLTPQQGSSGLHEAHTKVDLHIICSKKYPNEIPQILFENTKGISNNLLNELRIELKHLAKEVLGEVMIFQLAQKVQTFLFHHNKPIFKSFYDEMLMRRREQERQLQVAQQEEKDRERQVILKEIQERQEILKAESKLWRTSVSLENNEETTVLDRRRQSMSNRRCNSSYSSMDEEVEHICEHKGTQVIEFSSNGAMQVQRGRCIEHPFKDSVVYYSGLDIETGDLFVIGEWTINTENTDLSHVSRQVSSIEHETNYLVKLKHSNLVHYLNIQQHPICSKIIVYTLQEFIPGLNCSFFMKEHMTIDLDLLRHISGGVLAALEFLHRNNVVHKDLTSSCIFIGNSGTVKLANYSIYRRLSDMITNANSFPGYTKKTDIYNFGTVILSLIRGTHITEATVEIPNSISADLYDFLMRSLAKEEKDRFSAAQLLNHPFIRVPLERISPQRSVEEKPIAHGNSPEPTENDGKALIDTTTIGQSRVQNEFEVLQWIGKGAYGDVLKVMNKLDGGHYAIKRIQLNPKSKQLNRKITREVKLLSKLNHENVVRYYNAWIESAVIDSNDTGPSKTNPSKIPKVNHHKELTFNKDIELLAPPMKDVEWSISYNSKSKVAETNASSSDETSSDDDEDWGLNLMSSDSDSIEFEKNTSGTASEASTEGGNTEPEIINSVQIQFLYIQMEFCEKSTLRTAIDSGLHLDSDRIWRLFREILEGLVHIHQQGMIHRDLKPVNIFLDSNDHVKIGDFGLATTNILGKPDDITKNKSVQEHWAEGDSSLTGQVGTALYTAPELTSNTKTTYNQKVDIYSLGIIFFEMCYTPLNTQMERIKLLGGIRNPSIVFPTEFPEKHTKQSTIIRWLLNHDISKRPTSQELIQSELVPPPVLEEEKLREMFRHTLNNPQLKAYKYLMASCFEQTVTPVQDITYDLSLNTSQNLVKVLQLFHYVKNIILHIFHLHGGKYLPTPLFLPKSRYYDGVDTCVKVMTHSGSIVSIPHDLRVPFARYVAWNNINMLRRYSVEKVYREKKIFGFRPRETHECVFDIVTPSPGQFLMDAELLYMVNEVIDKIPELKNKSFIIRLNHTLLIKAILLHCSVKEDNHDDVYNILSDSKEGKITKFQLKTHLISLGLSDNSISTLLQLAELEYPLSKIASTLQMITKKKSNEASTLAKQGLQELKIILQNALAFGVTFSIVICPGLVNNIQQFSGMMCQFVCELKKKRRRAGMDVIASGGRYDSMIESYRNVREEANMFSKEIKQSCVGISISLDKLVQALQEEGGETETINKIRNTEVAVSSTVKPFIKEKIKILKDLWAAGIHSSLIDSIHMKEIEEYCIELNIPHMIMLKDDEQGMAAIHSRENDRFQGKLFKQSEIVESMRRIIKLWKDGFPDTSSNKLETKASEHINEPAISIVYVTSEKLPSVAKKRFENQIKSQLDSIFKRLTGEVIILALNIESSVVRTLASYLIFESEHEFQKSVKDVLDRHPRHKKYLLEVCDNIFEQITKFTSPIVILYSISDNYYRLIVI